MTVAWEEYDLMKYVNELARFKIAFYSLEYSGKSVIELQTQGEQIMAQWSEHIVQASSMLAVALVLQERDGGKTGEARSAGTGRKRHKKR